MWFYCLGFALVFYIIIEDFKDNHICNFCKKRFCFLYDVSQIPKKLFESKKSWAYMGKTMKACKKCKNNVKNRLVG